ncbi:MAG: helix-turn-helix transcriptional regulator [Deltaproteobacteria bacterium]|nr:helix-turn-helix transcriptional regulator [Deltaproteobacteria bacterium]
MPENFSSTVCLNAKAVRRIREDKKLTQLYVAKVVGVTTDTISRWENNRYPTMKTSNALRLAEALEVPLKDILQDEEPETVQKTGLRFIRLPRILTGFLVLLGIFIVFGLSYHRRMVAQSSVFATRHLPQFAAPGAVIPVRIHLQTEEENNNGFILRESFPSGWKIVESYPPPSSLDNERGVIRWISKRVEKDFWVNYLIKVDPQARLHTNTSFRGSLIAAPEQRTSSKKVEGAGSVRIAPFLWADENGDNQIDDKEMLMASKIAEEMKDVHLDWNLLQTIWDAGRYSFNRETQAFAPVSK